MLVLFYAYLITMGRKYLLHEVIEKAKKLHENKYDYSLVEYKNMVIPVRIICEKHGIFYQNLGNHIHKKSGCPKCASEKSSRRFTKDEFIQKAKEIHKDEYNYSLVEYKNNRTKVKIICEKHGVFLQSPSNHMRGSKCPLCVGGRKLTKKEFIQKARDIHGNKYDYSFVNYLGIDNKVDIVCSIHGMFKQSPHKHINRKSGCPYCNESHGEREIALFLTDGNVEFQRQKRWNECRDVHPMPFDFYIPEFNLAIEYDGEHHFMVKENWGGEEEFIRVKKRDKIKTEFCRQKGIKLLRISYKQNIRELLESMLIHNTSNPLE